MKDCRSRVLSRGEASYFVHTTKIRLTKTFQLWFMRMVGLCKDVELAGQELVINGHKLKKKNYEKKAFPSNMYIFLDFKRCLNSVTWVFSLVWNIWTIKNLSNIISHIYHIYIFSSTVINLNLAMRLWGQQPELYREKPWPWSCLPCFVHNYNPRVKNMV